MIDDDLLSWRDMGLILIGILIGFLAGGTLAAIALEALR